MFTGIVEELGEIVAVEPGGDSARLRRARPARGRDAAHGDSIAVNGVCLTVVEHGDGDLHRRRHGRDARPQPASATSRRARR